MPGPTNEPAHEPVHEPATRDPFGEDTVVLDDGRTVTIRPVNADDADALIAMHEQHSPRTVRRRFFSSMPHLPADQARRFADVDGVSRVALVAQAPSGELVAVARYDCLPAQAGPAGPAGVADRVAAEVAIVVTDDYQHHGLGVAILTRLVAVARHLGVDHFTADVLMDNRPMLATFRDAGLTYQAHTEAGVVHLELPLSGAVVDDDPGSPAASPG